MTSSCYIYLELKGLAKKKPAPEEPASCKILPLVILTIMVVVISKPGAYALTCSFYKATILILIVAAIAHIAALTPISTVIISIASIGIVAPVIS